MKVFLSWSGSTSHLVAKTFYKWLPIMINNLEPFLSSENIESGARSLTDLAKELENSSVGILCITKDNVNVPWLLFEAGALSKIMSESAVCPFLFDLKRSEVKGPIAQFQSTIFEKEEVRKLVNALNKHCGDFGLNEIRFNESFNTLWPDLEKALNQIKVRNPEQDVKNRERDPNNEILEEILEISRANQRLLNTPENIFPQDFFNLLSKGESDGNIYEKQMELFQELQSISYDLDKSIIQIKAAVSAYLNEQKAVDENFKNQFWRLMEVSKHLKVQTEKFEKVLIRRK